MLGVDRSRRSQEIVKLSNSMRLSVVVVVVIVVVVVVVVNLIYIAQFDT